LIARARMAASATSRGGEHPWKYLSDEELLVSAGLYLKDPKTGKEGYTLAAVLLFGNDETIKAACPDHGVDCLKRVNNLDRYDDRDFIVTNLLDTYDRMMAFIAKHLDAGFAQDENALSYSPRDLLFKEAVANVLIHREYRSKGLSTMTIFKDRVEFREPCLAKNYGPITPTVNFHPIPKNPRLAEAFRNMGLADELGSGVRNMFKYNKVYSGSLPFISEGDDFLCSIPLVSPRQLALETGEMKGKALAFVSANGRITIQDAISLFSSGKTKAYEILSSLVAEGKLFRHGQGKNTFYDSFADSFGKES
jgi:ATP-dependent DNA helicase RecG